MESTKHQRVKFTDVANMNATRTTPPYHPVQVEEEQKPTIKFRAADIALNMGEIKNDDIRKRKTKR